MAHFAARRVGGPRYNGGTWGTREPERVNGPRTMGIVDRFGSAEHRQECLCYW
jgi:hypothetical protein